MGLEQKISWRPEDQWEEAGEGRVLVCFGRGLEGRVSWGPEVHWEGLKRELGTRGPLEGSWRGESAGLEDQLEAAEEGE